MMNGTKPGVVLNCRTCTRACKQYKSLQDEIEIGPEGSTTLANMLQFCSSLSFEPQDGAAMPQHICMHCLQLLEQAFNFKRMVIDSDELLRLGLEEVDNNANASGSNQEYVMIEVLSEDAEPDAGKQDSSLHEVAALVEAYSEQEPEHEEFVVDDVCVDAEEEVGAETETEDAIEPINEFHAADIEYVTIKTEYDSQVEDEDEIEIIDSPPMETVSEQMQIQMLDDQMVMMSGEEPIDEVIGEVESEDILDIEREEHLIAADSEEGEEFMEDSDSRLSIPVVTGPPVEVLPHVCHVCNKAFRQQCRLNQHMRSHVDEKLYTCEMCGKKLKHLRNHKEHMLTHTNAKPHQCLVCARFYRTTSSLAAHMRTHAEDKPYKCDQCGRSYAAFDHLRRHKLTHTGERPYACDLCDKAYYDSSSLRQHKVSHTGEKAFTCEICGVGLSQKSGYKKHMLVHSGEKPHKCPICGRAFTFTSNLNAHVRLHSGEKPFKCDKCMKAFPTKKRLNSHLRVHNKETPVTSTTTGTNTSPDRANAVAAGRRTAANMPDVTDQQVSTSKVVVVL
ncbi:zinc finger protein 436 isoform X1 [Drosophila mojavensis]|uniref:Uncharacterized protein, isoform A n=1 Tax=Drosophila mojavensis TaxID=7230 RepID=B4L392_DROMO|nr:zinc finger protein 436 isoform X1 [Drosophila mojavensis]EDW07020.1 uncharacterized protein Dmoj_GI15092, isoform A [Drosophila mojavensis]